MDKSNFIMQNATLFDIDSMLALDRALYPEIWWVDRNFIINIKHKNGDCFRILKSNGVLKGQYTILPLPKEPYEAVMQNKISEYELHNHVLDNWFKNDVYMYIATVAVDTTDPLSQKYAVRLLMDMHKTMSHFLVKGMKIKEIGAIAISDPGISLAERLGMTLSHYVYYNNQPHSVYRASIDNILALKHKFRNHNMY